MGFVAHTLFFTDFIGALGATLLGLAALADFGWLVLADGLAAALVPANHNSTWLVRLYNGSTLPRARGSDRFKIGPPLTKICLITNSSGFNENCSSALATAD